MPASLEELWTSGREGTRSPLETLRAHCYYKIFLEMGVPEGKVFAKVASQVEKIGGGHPGNDAIRKMLLKIEEDPAWFPGSGKMTESSYSQYEL